jgi:hypothetical protein
MKDVTTTSFGLLIAYLLPGAVALYGAVFWFPSLAEVYRTLLSAKSDATLFLLIAIAALVIGLLINTARWLFFERTICKGYGLSPDVFRSFTDEHKLQAFLLVIEETFRYQQFLGNIAIQTPFLYLSWLKWYDPSLIGDGWFLALTIIFCASITALFVIRYEVECGVAGAKGYFRNKSWARRLHSRLGGNRWSQWILFGSCVILIVLYLIFMCFKFSGLNGKYILFFITLSFLASGLAVGANAVAAQKRYAERGNMLKGGG